MARQKVTTVSDEDSLTATGVVQYVPDPKQVQTKKGPKLTYSFKMDDTWYNCGFINPEVNQGNRVSFSYIEDAYGFRVDTDTLKISKTTAPSSTKTNQKFPDKTKNTTGLSKDQYWENKEKKDEETQLLITFQASRNAAIEVVAAALQAECIVLPAKVGNRFDNVLSLVDEITEKFYQDALARSTKQDSQEVVENTPEAVESEEEVDEDTNGDD